MKNLIDPMLVAKAEELAIAFAASLDVNEAAKRCRVTAQVAVQLLSMPIAEERFRNEVYERRNRVRLDGDMLLAELVKVARDAAKAKQFDVALKYYKMIGEMIGAVGAPSVNVNAENAQLVFGDPRKKTLPA